VGASAFPDAGCRRSARSPSPSSFPFPAGLRHAMVRDLPYKHHPGRGAARDRGERPPSCCLTPPSGPSHGDYLQHIAKLMERRTRRCSTVLRRVPYDTLTFTLPSVDPRCAARLRPQAAIPRIPSVYEELSYFRGSLTLNDLNKAFRGCSGLLDNLWQAGTNFGCHPRTCIWRAQAPTELSSEPYGEASTRLSRD
jgi:hypothetical protein